MMRAVSLGEHVGSEVVSIDLRAPVDDDAQDRLRDELASRHLLLFREQDITAEQQVRLLSVFGEVVDEAGDGTRNSFVSNTREDGVLAEGKPLVFHADNMFTPQPLSTVSLYGLRVSGPTAPTRFANAERACAALTDEQRDELADARVLNLSGFAGGWYRYRDAEVEPHHPRAVHPVIAANPRSGNAALRVSEQQSDRILDWPPARSEAMLQHLFGLLYAEDNVYEHDWRTGDLVVWDNLALQHGRDALPASVERTLRRVSAVDARADEQAAWTLVSRAAEADWRQRSPRRERNSRP
ncbi:MAG TPA: TauD/TfdA family dioxygenase [Acidimicrobiales bacterium]|jgi:taurine dioxygenase|nr:TauD/TfdA family dioxygenase [Acidimicrobiales bacterium]